MLRAYLVVLIVIGIAASMLSRAPSSSPASPDTVHLVRPGLSQRDDATRPDPSDSAANLDGSVELHREPNGHFYADVEINGTTVHMLVDTGATGIALSRDDAQKAGIATSIGMNDVVGDGADGSVHGEFVTIDRISLGSASGEKMRATVLNSGEQSLLGQTFLQKFASVEIHGDTMTLR
jgi:aspartyl protease family protein